MRKPPPPTTIERVEAPTREVFEREYADLRRPVIFTGVVDKWPAFERWNADYLRSIAGDKTISARYDSEGDHANFYTPSGDQTSEMTLGALLDGLLADPPDTRHYLSQYQIKAIDPRLLDDIDYSRYVDAAQAVCFIGRRSYTPMHHHGNAEAAMCQVVGTKTVNLYPPEQSHLMYAFPWYTKIMNFSQVDDRNADLQRFPRFGQAKPITATVRPGEWLFIPVHWWHSVQGSDLSVTVTVFWNSIRSRYHFPTPALQVYTHELLAPISMQARWRKLMRKLGRTPSNGKPSGPGNGRSELGVPQEAER